MTIEEFLKDWDKKESSLVDFICNYFKDDKEVEFYEIDRNCAWFMDDNDVEKADNADILLLINRIEN